MQNLRFELVKLVYRHGLSPAQVSEQVREYEKFIGEGGKDKPEAGAKAPAKGPKKRGDPFS